MRHRHIAILGTLLLMAEMPQVYAENDPLSMDDFAYGAQLTTSDAEFRRISVNPTMMNNIYRRDFGDVGVYDEDNELMPTLVRKINENIETNIKPLKFSQLVVSGESKGYILDRSVDQKQWLRSLHLQWKHDATPSILLMRVEHGSGDGRWSTLEETVVINNYRYKDVFLKQNIIDLNEYADRYIKLTFLNKRSLAILKSVSAYTSNKKPVDYSWVSAGKLQLKAGTTDRYLFSVGEGVTPDLLRLDFDKLNTVVSGNLHAVAKAGTKLQRAVSKPFDAYKVTLNNKVVSSKPVDISQWQVSDWMIAADASYNVDSKNLPKVMVAYPKYEIIFAADGAEPYTVVWGNRNAGSSDFNDITQRIQANKLSIDDIPMVAPGNILDTAGLTDLLESRRMLSLLLWLGVTIVTLGIVIVLVKIAYQRRKVRSYN